MTKSTLHAAPTKNVLIIEDEGDMCLLLNIILAGKEFECDHVKSLAAAQEYLSQEQPAVVLLDNKLPDGFGVDFIAYIKTNYPDVKIVMISGFDGSVKDVALESGADVFLEKPFTKTQLHDAILHALHATAEAPIY
jgi:two-component system OmpR family response regulator